MDFNEYYFKGENISSDRALRIIKLKEDGSLDRRYRINKGWTIKNHIRDYYERVYLERAREPLILDNYIKQ